MDCESISHAYYKILMYIDRIVITVRQSNGLLHFKDYASEHVLCLILFNVILT